MAKLSPRHARALKAEAHDLPALVQVGKHGLTEPVVREIEAQLEDHGLVKVRLLAAAREGAERRALAEEMARRTASALVEVRGNTVVLYREPAD